MITGRGIAPGDVIVGVPSSGLHTNGYSLARRIVFDRLGLDVSSHVERARRRPWARRCSRRIARICRSSRRCSPIGAIKGMAHITGGGITDNLPRVLPEGTAAEIDRRAWTVPPLFDWLVSAGDVPLEDAYRTFNMGMGLLVVVGARTRRADARALRACG